MKAFLAAALCGASLASQAAVVLSEGFDNVAGLAAKGWVQTKSGSGAGSGWLQGNPAVFTAQAGASNAYAAANYVDSATSISDWLFTPVVILNATSKASFAVRFAGEGFLDTVQFYASAAGASVAPADFTLLGTYSSRDATPWLDQFVTLTRFNGYGRLAFRYFVADTAVDGNYAGIDTLRLDTVPEPATLALVGLALAGVVLGRRRV